MKNKDHFGRRLAMCIIGVLLSGVAVGFFKMAVFGVDPFQAMMSGLDALVPLSFGILYIIANALLLLFSLFFDRHYIGLATFINLFLLGYIVQFSWDFLLGLFPNVNMLGRIVFLIIGILISCIAGSLYFTADLGVSTYDAVALIITQTWKKGQFRFVRIGTDLACVALGVVMYLISGNSLKGLFGLVGAGTIIAAFFMGPLIDLFNRKISRPILYRK